MSESRGVRLPAAAVVLVVCMAGGASYGATSSPGADWEVLDRTPGRGEQCLVCSQPIVEETAVRIRHQGRTFHVKESMLPELRRAPDLYFRKLQARSGLFDEEAIVQAPALRWGWLAGGVYLLAGLLSAAVAGSVAMVRSRAVVPWFLAGLVGNVVALGALFAVGRPRGAATLEGRGPAGLTKIPRTRSPRPCPRCGASNHPAAAVCPSCGAILDPEVEAETRRVEGRER